jgi:hypothetical protein
MKTYNLVLMAVAVLMVTGCSSSSNNDKKDGGNGGTVSQAGLAMVGEWISDCARDQQSGAFYREDLQMKNNGSGEFAYLVFQDNMCTQGGQKQQPKAFTFSAAAVFQGSSKVTLIFTGQAPVEVSVIVQNSRMTVTTPKGTVTYQKATLTNP